MLLLLLCSLLPLASTQVSTFIEPRLRGTGVEIYDNEDESYAIYLKKVSFAEANVLCMSKPGGGLLEFTDSRVAEFMGQALAESAVGFSSVWIGAQYFPPPGSSRSGVTEATSRPVTQLGVWKWLSGDVIEPHPIPDATQFPMDNLPFWLDRPNLDTNEALCLAMDRNKHHRPIILALPCGVKRPFVCSIPPSGSKTDPVLVPPPVKVNDKHFYLFQASSTWAEALAFCRTLNYRLAVVTKRVEFIKLEQRMMRARPIFENAWIGGKFIKGKWLWIATNEVIGTKSTTSSNASTPETSTDDSASPWYRPDHIIMDGCLLADRHVCDYFVYVEERCDRKRNIICEDDHEVGKDLFLPVPGPLANIWISTVERTWQDAQDLCRSCMNGNLLQFDFKNVTFLKMQLRAVYAAMAIVSTPEIRHLWMNAHLFGGTHFTWGNSATTELRQQDHNYTLLREHWSNSTQALLGFSGEDGYVFYCPGNLENDPTLRTFKCLNMDRENQKHYIMYGLSCLYKQHFMCVPDGVNNMFQTAHYNCTWDYFRKQNKAKTHRLK